jgi:putative flippase GtrA
MEHPVMKRGIKLGGFLAAGLPSFILAIPLNWFLVKGALWSEAGAYALVLVFQVVLNFFMCRWFVFTDRKATPLWIQFGQFMSGILFFRLADWALYTFLVSVLDWYFIAVQVGNIFIFALLKFKFSQKVMER